MSSSTRWIGATAAILCSGLVAVHFLLGEASGTNSHGGTKERARVVLTKALPKLNSANLKVVLVEVNYGPGEASPPHSHPCSVIGYVIEGTLRSKVEGEPEMTYQAGDSFYEAPNGVHLVSANASSTEPAKLVAYLLCDHDAPLSVDMPARHHQEGASR